MLLIIDDGINEEKKPSSIVLEEASSYGKREGREVEKL